MPFIATCRYLFRAQSLRLRPAPSREYGRADPLGGRPECVWFLPDADGHPDTEQAEAVLLDGRHGVVMSPGSWIRYAYPLIASADFAYISARVDPEEDIERVYLERDQDMVLEWYLDTTSGAGIETTPGGAVLKLPLATGQSSTSALAA